MADYFTFIPSTNYSQASKPRVNSIKFGGGYSQRVPESYNSIEKAWSLTFENRPFAEANALISFLEDKRGAEAFFFTPPDETNNIHSVVCSEWGSVTTSPFTKTISCSFVKVYE